MAKVFEPRRAIYVPASSPHPKNTEYRVAWGMENWSPVGVTKVQMVYNGKVAGMLSPSYPDHTLDEQAVDLAKLLLKQDLGTSSNKSKVVLCLKKLESDNLDELIEATEDELHNMHLDMYSSDSALSPVVHVKLKDAIKQEDSLYTLIFKVEIT